MDTPFPRNLLVGAWYPSMEPWPPSHGYVARIQYPRLQTPPSMEPWPPSHGYAGQLSDKWTGRPAFNGAMASQPWIRCSKTASTTLKSILQWSHGLPAMDTQRPVYRVVPVRRPSMEPWPPSHGYSACAVCGAILTAPSMEPWPPSHGYQRHGTSGSGNCGPSMEPWPPSHGYNLSARRNRLAGDNLQWSHGLPAMDTPLRIASLMRALLPSMEPWPPSHGYNLGNIIQRLGELPSMEPWPPSHGYSHPMGGRACC